MRETKSTKSPSSKPFCVKPYSEMEKDNDDLDYERNNLQVERDRAIIEAKNVKNDMSQLTADYNKCKEELDNANKAIYSKDQYIEEKRGLIKQIVKDLKTEKKSRKQFEMQCMEKTTQVEDLQK